MNLELDGKRVIITGASRGIGARVAVAFAQEGANVALIARSADDLGQVIERATAHGVRATAIVADLTPRGAAEQAIARSVEQLGGVDILINNAGASPFGSFDAISDAAWHGAFELKVMGYVRCTRAALPHMRAQGHGTIVNVVGAAGRHATAGYALGALNAALLHLTRSLAEHVAGDGIRVSALNPGFTNTERVQLAMAEWARAAGADVQSYAANYVSRLPLQRFAEPEEIARLVVLLASEGFALTLGSSLQADGGSTPGQF